MALIILKIISLIFGYGLIISSFIIFGDSLESNILTLDIIVSCIIYSLFAQLFFFPMIDTNKAAQKEVGMMGIHYTFMWIYTILAIIIMIVGASSKWTFNVQLISQLIIFFILLLGLILTLVSGNKVESVHSNEQSIMSGKILLSDSMTQLMEDVANTKELNPTVVERLNQINENIRFITPSNNPMAQKLDLKFCDCIGSISVMIRNTTLNASSIEDAVNNLERIFIQRKKY